MSTYAELMAQELGQIQAAADAAKTTIKTLITPVYNADGYPVSNGDDATAINAAIDAAYEAGGGLVCCYSDKYTLLTSIIQKSNVHLQFGPNTVVDMSNVTPIGIAKYGIRAVGTVGDAILLSDDCAKGTYTCSAISVTGLSVGDYVQLGTEGGNYYPYAISPAYNVDRGEIKRVRLIDAETNTITFEEAVYDDYTTSCGAFICKVNFVENISVDRLKLVGDSEADSNEYGVYFAYVNGFQIKNCDLEDQDWYQIGLVSCIRGSVHHNKCRLTHYDGTTGTIFYGIAVISCCQWLNVSHNFGERCRHLVVTTALTTGQGYWGKPRFIVIEGNIAKNMMAGDSGRSYGFEHHGFGEDIIFNGNIVDSCYAGFNIEGGGITLVNNIIKNWYYAGIMIDTQAAEIKNLIIANNQIGDFTVEGGGYATPHAIYATIQSADIIENVAIENNIISYDLTKSSAIYLTGASVAVENVSINNNKIKNSNENIGTQYAVVINLINGVSINDNEFYDTKNGINATGDNITISNNSFDAESGRTFDSGYMIYIKGASPWVDGNKIRQCNTGVRVDAACTGDVIVANNIIRADNATINDGTGAATKQNNIEIVY